MTTRIVEGQLPYTGGTGIGIDANKVISILLREEDNLIKVNGDNELYTDLQLAVNITPSDEFPVGVTVGKVLQADGWSQNGLLLHRQTTSGDYARWLYGADGELYFDNGTGTWKQVYYSDEVDALFTALRGELATVAFTGDYNDLINRPAFLQVQSDWSQTDNTQPDYIKNKPTIPTVNDATLTIQKNGTSLGTFTANSSTNTTVNVTVPNVINNVTSTSTSDALSANQGKELQDQIDDLKAMGRFLSLWDATTGQPISFPLSTPYNYQTGDYYLVETVSTATPPVNYKPSGTQYTGTASSTAETEELEVGDLYIYDGTVWLLQINHGKTVSFANLAGQPTDNANLATALNAKADATDLNTKTFYLSSTSDLTNAQAAYDWYIAGKNPIIMYNGTAYIVIPSIYSQSLCFSPTSLYIGRDNSKTTDGTLTLAIFYSGDTVTSIQAGTAGIRVLETDRDYSTPYTPLYNGSPTTKKYVDDRDTYIGSSAPTSNLVEGRLWYDTTNDQLKVYDGTNWNVTGKEYHAGEGIEIKNGPDYSAMQGPAPDGFHVPLNTERQAIYDIWTALGGGSSDGTNFGIALKLPFAGFRDPWTAEINDQGYSGRYWSSSCGTVYTDYSSYLYFGSSALNPQNDESRANGFSARCFKDEPTVPTLSWTKLYGTSIEAGGIFWNSTDGLISLSGDGQTWITISDKNLGATTVWNSGDTLSEANCGKYYQRGNNYGFPGTGEVISSSTQVDASNYGPGNYYNSSTFIVGYGDWSSVQNDNLWGGVTGIIDNAITNTGVLSVNGQTGDVTVNEVPSGGNNGDVLTNVSGTPTWQAPSGGDVMVSSQAYNLLSPGMKIWAGGDTQYQALTKDTNTVYLTVPYVAVTGVTLNESSISLTTVGDTYQLTATVTPNDATYQNITWSSSDTTVATVSNSGLVTCVTPGNATITATADGQSATCGVTGGGGGGWQPGADTLAYYPMDVDLDDHSGNSLTTTVSGNVSVGTIGGISAGYFGSVGGLMANVTATGDLTAMGWIYKSGEPNYDCAFLVGYCQAGNAGSANLGALIYAKTRPEVINNKPCATVFDFPTYGSNIFPDGQLVANQWNHVAVTINRTSGLVTLYVNGVSQGSYTSSGKSQASYPLGAIYISRKDSYDRSWIGYISEAIFESKEWTGTEISNYYNDTKGDYGIS